MKTAAKGLEKLPATPTALSLGLASWRGPRVLLAAAFSIVTPVGREGMRQHTCLGGGPGGLSHASKVNRHNDRSRVEAIKSTVKSGANEQFSLFIYKLVARELSSALIFDLVGVQGYEEENVLWSKTSKYKLAQVLLSREC